MGKPVSASRSILCRQSLQQLQRLHSSGVMLLFPTPLLVPLPPDLGAADDSITISTQGVFKGEKTMTRMTRKRQEQAKKKKEEEEEEEEKVEAAGAKKIQKGARSLQYRFNYS